MHHKDANKNKIKSTDQRISQSMENRFYSNVVHIAIQRLTCKHQILLKTLFSLELWQMNTSFFDQLIATKR
jgi:hypothetical protein